MNLLTLDLATRIGWTVGPITDPKCIFGAHLLPSTGDDIGRFIAAYDEWLREKLEKVWAQGLVVFEAPILPALGKTSIATLRKLYGLAAHTEFLCHTHKIECKEAPMQSVRAFLQVKGKGDEIKRNVVARVRQYGYDTEDKDAADALAVRLYTISAEFPDLMRRWKFDLGELGLPRTAA